MFLIGRKNKRINELDPRVGRKTITTGSSLQFVEAGFLVNETNPASFLDSEERGVSRRRFRPKGFSPTVPNPGFVIDGVSRHHVRIGDLNLARRFDRWRNTSTHGEFSSREFSRPLRILFSVLRAILFSLDIICRDPEPSRNYPKKKETPCQASCGEKSNEWGGRLETRVLLPFLENMFEENVDIFIGLMI